MICILGLTKALNNSVSEMSTQVWCEVKTNLFYCKTV